MKITLPRVHSESVADPTMFTGLPCPLQLRDCPKGGQKQVHDSASQHSVCPSTCSPGHGLRSAKNARSSGHYRSWRSRPRTLMHRLHSVNRDAPHSRRLSRAGHPSSHDTIPSKPDRDGENHDGKSRSTHPASLSDRETTVAFVSHLDEDGCNTN